MRTPIHVGVVLGSDADLDLVRAFHALPHAHVRWICDETGDAGRLDATRIGAAWTSQLSDLLDDETLDAVALLTPPAARRQQLRDALEADQHVFVAGPVASTQVELEELLKLARRRRRMVWTHEPALFRPSVRRLRTLLARGGLGELLYLHSTRLGRVDGREPSGALWSGCAELLALVLDVVADEAIEISARAEAYVRLGTPEVVFVDLRFATGITAHLHVSALDGYEVHRLTAVGSSLTAALDFRDPRHELVLAVPADADADAMAGEGTTLAPGEMMVARLADQDPVALSCQAFLEAVRSPAGRRRLAPRSATALAAALDAVSRACVVPEQEPAPQPLRPSLQVVKTAGR